MLFERSFFSSDVVLSCVVFVCGHAGFVDYAGVEAVIIKRALVFYSTVAFVWGDVIVGSCYRERICIFFYG